jgi:gamma-glutamyl-gamma-aminobutyrate hydrolase PuuD
MPCLQKEMTIGISGHSRHSKSVRAIMRQIRRTGHRCHFLSAQAMHFKSAIHQTIESIDALVLMGNNLDIDPKEYLHRYPKGNPKANIHPMTRSEMDNPASAARARFEKALLEKALALGMPVLGICGGMQRINSYCGGTLHQHLPDLVGGDKHMQHKQGIAVHVPVVPIIIKDGTMLSAIAQGIRMSFCKDHPAEGPKVIMENSIHHQAIDRVGEDLLVCAITDTVKIGSGRFGYLPEAIEAAPEGKYRGQFLLGVQWHPEFGASAIGEHIIRHMTQAALTFKGRRYAKFNSPKSLPDDHMYYI